MTRSDTTATRAEIDELVGQDGQKLVEGLTKLKKLDLVSEKAERAENLLASAGYFGGRARSSGQAG